MSSETLKENAPVQIPVWENSPQMVTKESNEHRGIKLSSFDCKRSLKKCETSQHKPNHSNNGESEQALGQEEAIWGRLRDTVDRVIKKETTLKFSIFISISKIGATFVSQID